ncbi:aspartate--tRNA ligase [Dictyocaulus viviparus]|uniref:Aspartate--tRNA ligase n=1 Tax=Dictyocaulus viviparus TaxID=29172 RepID=A0A0D8Y6K8_DICVI|nr:aspartate--tRNA ligase [Dictyocaulus viviparus]
MGWVVYKRMNRFLVLRDAYGTVQALVDPESPFSKVVKDLHYESVVQVEGTVVSRGDNVNLKMKTGEIEIDVSKLTVLNHSSSILPLLPDSVANERTRLTYRYIDLRSERLQKTLRLRSNVVHKMRCFLIDDAKFVDVETPTMFRRTPGGAAEFIVPASSPNQGLCYTLPQSPQQFKQLLMIGAIDRYFQVARCYRDESSKGDRQLEFTQVKCIPISFNFNVLDLQTFQVDLELSFTNQDGVMTLVEEMLMSAWPEHLDYLKPSIPFPRLNYDESMQLYGSDKPDMRIDWQIEDCTQKLGPYSGFLRGTNSCSDDWVARFIICKKQASVNRKPFAIFDRSKDVWFKNFDKNELVTRYDIGEEDCIVFSWGDKEGVHWTLGQLRNLIADAGGLRKEKKICAHWIVNFPLFLMEDGKLTATHHPFTAPINEHKHWLNDARKLPEIIGQHYDLVMNGVELGGGSIRIHDANEQAHVLKILGQNIEEMSHLLEALSFGSPPHGGFALGLDRYIALLAGEGDPSVPVREVIAFPKSKEGRDLMSKAPANPSVDELKRYGIQFVINEKREESMKDLVMVESES